MCSRYYAFPLFRCHVLIYPADVRKVKLFLPLVWLVWSGLAVEAASLKVMKVLPQYLDRDGRHTVSPSLYDRDAYQVQLRRRPEERSGIRFAVQWKAPNSASLKLRIDLRGAHGKEPTTATLEQPVQHRGFLSNWSFLKLTGPDYKQFGELLAWRATLWNGSQQVGEQKSFLW